MANKKKKKANRPKKVAGPSTEKLAKDKAEFEASVEAAQEEKSTPVPKKEAKTSGKDKDKDKGKGKEKEKTVVKSRARATNPSKTNKKPNIFRRFVDYIKQVRLEIKRTTWPTGNEVLNMTIIVLVALLFFGVFIFLIDFVMVRFVEFYGQLVPTAEVDASALTDDLTTAAAEGELEGDVAAVKLLGGLDLSGLKSLFGGE